MEKVYTIPLLKDAFRNWKDGDAFNNSVIIAYYSIFSLPGLLVIIVNLAGYFFGEQAVTNQISGQIGSAVGEDTAKSIQDMIAKASQQRAAGLATIIGAFTLILGATGAFYQLRQLMNKMWGVEPDPKNKLMKVLVDRAASLSLILIIGFLLLVSLVLSAAVAGISKWLGENLSDGVVVLFTVLDFVISIGVITVLFAAMFKFLPDIRIRWKYVWPGAVLTALLFVIAKFGLAIYFSKTDPGSTYGAAGSVILIMLWVTYSALIMFFGAEFTKVYAQRNGARVTPRKGAVHISQGTVRGPRTTPQPDDRRQQMQQANPDRRRDAPSERYQGEDRPDAYHEPPS